MLDTVAVGSLDNVGVFGVFGAVDKVVDTLVDTMVDMVALLASSLYRYIE